MKKKIRQAKLKDFMSQDKLMKLQERFWKIHDSMSDILSKLPRWNDDCNCKELNPDYVTIVDDDEDKLIHVCPVCGGDVNFPC